MKTREIADFLSAELIGDDSIEIVGLAALSKAAAGEISFFEKEEDFATDASAVIVSADFQSTASCTIVRVENPRLAFALLALRLCPTTVEKSWHSTAYISAEADVHATFVGAFVSVGAGTLIGESSVIHDGVRIGRNANVGVRTTIHPNCVIYDGAQIGDDCVIHAGTVVGSDGFGYVKDAEGAHHQFPQIGSVVIEENVEIGANCTIDRGSLGVTRIGSGTKIDNLVHIAHNVQIGKRVLIAGQSGIAGSSVVGDDVVIAGQVGIADHVTIHSGAVIGAKSAVFPNKIIRPGVWSGIPVRLLDEYVRQNANIRGLQKIKDDVKKLKKES